MIRGVAPLHRISLMMLGGAGMVLLTLTAREIRQADTVATPMVDWTPRLSTAAEPLTAGPPLTASRQTTARPVFFKTRHPFVPPPLPPPPPPQAAKPAAPPAPPADPGLAVGGVTIINGTKKAYLFTKTDRNGSWLGEGEQITGWKVKSIDGAGAKLTKDGREIELPLYANP